MSDILNNAFNLKISDSQVSAAYLNDVRVWPPGVGLWAFNIPADGSILEIKLGTIDNSNPEVNWGDTPTEETLLNNVITDHTYDFTTDISTWTGALSVVYPDKITSFEARNITGASWSGTGSQPYPKFAGVIDLKVTPNIINFFVDNHSTEIIGLETLTEIVNFRNWNNDSKGKLVEDISNCIKLNVYNINSTNYTGPTHTTLPVGMDRYVVNNNKLTEIPIHFDSSFNKLQYYYVYNNNITGLIPTLSSICSTYNGLNPNNTRVSMFNNGLTDIVPGWSVNDNIEAFEAQSNNLSAAAMDTVLEQFDLFGKKEPITGNWRGGAGGFINLSRQEDITQTVSQSVIDTHISSLTANGWTVTIPFNVTYPAIT
tara:strand:+ start:4170 stop:5282 length:1113 start_codon:yes stop_codon:yes gene_type:complete